MQKKLKGLTMNLESANKDKLRAVFPECFTEGRLDIDKLLSLCGEYITDDFEKYEFKWKGKSDCLRLAQKRSTATLRPVPGDSVNWDTTQNLYIEGDNLEVLKLLQKSYFRKVKMIYIDPPYNTGNDFVYEDDFADPLARYKEVTAQTTKSNPETMGRYHTNWLNMMYPRLRLAANLLRDDGVIFISIDDNELDNLKKLCNETFGEENFIATIIWQKRTSPDMRTAFSTAHEYILMYAKDISTINSAVFPLPLTEQDKANFSNPDNDPKGPWVSSDFTAPGFRPNQMYSITTPSGVVVQPPQGRCWKNLEEVYLQYLNDGRLWFGADGKGVPRQKTYLFERNGKVGWTWWTNSEVGHTQEGTQELKALLETPTFDFPKPVRLVQRMVALASKSDDIILDFFSGSATTAHAVMQLNAEDGGNRRFIMVQLPEVCDEKSEAARNGYPNICEIGKERIRRAGKKLMQQVTSGQGTENGEGFGCGVPSTEAEWEYATKNVLDIGFKVFRLDSSNLKLWDDTPIESGDLDSLFARMNGIIDNLKPGRSEDDLVYEILLKMGYPLTADVAALEVDGLTVYTVEQNSMLICLQPGVTAETVEKLAVLGPKKIVLIENALADNSAMSNAHYLLENRGIELKIV